MGGNMKKGKSPLRRTAGGFVKAKQLGCLFLLGLLLVVPVAPGPAVAADCKALVQSIRQERELIKRKDLLASAITECANDAEINYMYGYSLERLRKYDEAVKYYLIASGLDKKKAKAFFGMGDLYMILGDVKNSVAAYEKGLAIEPGNKRAAKSLESARIKLKAASGKSVSTEEAVTIMLAEKSKDREVSPIEATILRLLILFPGKATELPESGADQLSLVVGRALMSPDLQDAVFEVAGHTDDSGKAVQNAEISRKRAEAVRRYLIDNVDVDPKRLQIAAYGQTQPVVPNTTEQNRKMNNRVEFKRLK